MSKINDITPKMWDVARSYSKAPEQTELTFGEHEAARAKATATQVGGTHYKDMAIQPVEFIQQNNLGFCEGNVVKYICRYQSKGKAEDLRKAKHYIDLILGDLEC